MLSGAAAVACGSTGPTPGGDASADALADSGRVEGGACSIKPPAGRVCVTVCYEQATPKNIEEPCEVYCDLPDAGSQAGTCYSATGTEYDCNREVFPDGGAQVLC
jgi:hypothetical protein